MYMVLAAQFESFVDPIGDSAQSAVVDAVSCAAVADHHAGELFDYLQLCGDSLCCLAL
jgi:multidrug efflux pump subunit AcrB